MPVLFTLTRHGDCVVVQVRDPLGLDDRVDLVDAVQLEVQYRASALVLDFGPRLLPAANAVIALSLLARLLRLCEDRRIPCTLVSGDHRLLASAASSHENHPQLRTSRTMPVMVWGAAAAAAAGALELAVRRPA
ncbi:hypothetical protein ACIRBX_24730 [Kitasatospora sp. NPDC096147]|uniref:hypothetical protein n=1 Tax=Kitasatospora sp. NPDC096147 TaxID=3364093 RepID=UPI0037F5E5F6